MVQYAINVIYLLILHSALTPLIRFFFRSLLSLLLIALIICGGQFLLEQVRMLRSSTADLRGQTSIRDALTAYKRQLASRVHAGVSKVGSDSLREVDLRISLVRRTLQENTTEEQLTLFSCPLYSPTENVQCQIDFYEKKLTAAAARQELTYLQQLRAYLLTAANRDAVYRELKRRAIVNNATGETLLQFQDDRNKLNRVDRYRLDKSLMLDKKLEVLKAHISAAERAYKKAQIDYQEQVTVVAHVSALARRPVFSLDQAAIDAVTQDMAERFDRSRAAVTSNWVTRFVAPVIAVLPLAFVVLLSAFVGHVIVKAFFYYVLAPLAARRPAIRLEAQPPPQLANTRRAPTDRPDGVSAVSHAVWLEADEELLILPEFLQSLSSAAMKDAKFVLDTSCLWTSLVSGMYMLTRIRTNSREDRIVISSDADPMSEVALVTISAGSAMVFQPRGIVGVIYRSSTPLKISRRWQIFSAHAWLTLQLRYLIFRGPVTLIVRGSRGVRVEPAGHARTISQYATLGFSSHLSYATVRSATFWPYYQNRTALLQDKFEGENGYYVYDETPRCGRGRGFFSRGLEGLTDAVLKVFGI